MKEFLILALLSAAVSCKWVGKTPNVKKDRTMVFSNFQNDSVKNGKVLKKLYKIYKEGEISECKYKGETVYSATLNAYDADVRVYDGKGEVMGSSNYGWGRHVDTVCRQLTDCRVIYRVKGNIWGMPAVDKYGLAERIP